MFTKLLTTLFLTLLAAQLAAAARGPFFKRSAAIAQPRGSGSYHRLHEVLGIGDNHNEDIRANIILNMEGL